MSMSIDELVEAGYLVADTRQYSLEIRPAESAELFDADRRVVMPAAELIKGNCEKLSTLDTDSWEPVNPGANPPEPEILVGTYMEVSRRADEINHTLGWPSRVSDLPVGAMPGYLAFPSPIEPQVAR